MVGILKGFDQLMNLVLDEVKETLRGMLDCASASASFSQWGPCGS